MTKQVSEVQKNRIRKQAAARQRRLRAKRIDTGFLRREFNLNDQENAAVIVFIGKLRGR